LEMASASFLYCCILFHLGSWAPDRTPTVFLPIIRRNPYVCYRNARGQEPNGTGPSAIAQGISWRRQFFSEEPIDWRLANRLRLGIVPWRRVIQMRGNPLAEIGRLCTHGREKIAQRLPHTVQLVEQMQNDGDTLIIDADIALEVVDQMHSREVDFGKLIVAALLQRKEPTLGNPCFQHIGVQMRTDEKLLKLHAHYSVA